MGEDALAPEVVGPGLNAHGSLNHGERPRRAATQHGDTSIAERLVGNVRRHRMQPLDVVTLAIGEDKP